MTISLLSGDNVRSNCRLVPAEVSCILGMILLEDFGMITSNVAERPGARVSLRLRPTADEVRRFGGPARVVDALESSFQKIRALVRDENAVREKIYGSQNHNLAKSC